MKQANSKRHRVGVFLYDEDFQVVEALRVLVGTRSRSAIIRLALRQLKKWMEKKHGNIVPQR